MTYNDYYYRCYYNIQQRCYNENNPHYDDYGGRGITCYWNDVDSFRQYIIETIGEKPDGKSIDRAYNDGNYEPGNLRWLTPKQQRDNQREYTRHSRSNVRRKPGYQYVSQTRSGKYIGKVQLNGRTYYTSRHIQPVQAHLQALSLRSFLIQ